MAHTSVGPGCEDTALACRGALGTAAPAPAGGGGRAVTGAAGLTVPDGSDVLEVTTLEEPVVVGGGGRAGAWAVVCSVVLVATTLEGPAVVARAGRAGTDEAVTEGLIVLEGSGAFVEGPVVLVVVMGGGRGTDALVIAGVTVSDGSLIATSLDGPAEAALWNPSYQQAKRKYKQGWTYRPS
jgi:hypothetical protein